MHIILLITQKVRYNRKYTVTHERAFMCFSASASFLASGFLSLVAVQCFRKHRNKTDLLLTSIPTFFALQQASEGILWLSINHTWLRTQQIMPYIFLLFAFFVWPIWIPLLVTIIEPHHERRHYLIPFAMLGIITGCYLYGFLILHGVTAQALSCHIYYTTQIPETAGLVIALAYALATITPFFISSLPTTNPFGVALLASYVFSYVMYLKHFISLWCFFAALLSGFVYYMITKKIPGI